MSFHLPAVRSCEHHASFEIKARTLGLDPSDPWVGGYVEYEWEHLRHLIEALPTQIAGSRVLEVGCNLGASAVVLSQLGAVVTAFDVSADFVELAQLNALRYGHVDIVFDHIEDSRSLPYATHQFDMICCNSVLEYVPAAFQQSLISELSRVLSPGGLVLVTGTSNRLWPREVHSQRWFTNYLPSAFDVLLRSSPQRGLFPWRLKEAFGKTFFNLDTGSAGGYFARSRTAMGMSPCVLRGILMAARTLQVGPGFLTPSMSCVLQKIR
jgi:SAM-dependent methyltransferase